MFRTSPKAFLFMTNVTRPRYEKKIMRRAVYAECLTYDLDATCYCSALATPAIGWGIRVRSVSCSYAPSYLTMNHERSYESYESIQGLVSVT